VASGYGFIAREYVNLGEAPYRNIGKAVVTQARLGEPLRILSQQGGWYEVEMSDTYRGFLAPLDLILTDEATWETYLASPQVLVSAHFTHVFGRPDFSVRGQDATTLLAAATLGTELRLLAEGEQSYQVLLPDGQSGYLRKEDGTVIRGFKHIPKGSGSKVVALAKEFLGLAYFWGGTTPYGFDCSGFVQTIYKMNGIHVLRDANQQYEMGVAVARDEWQTGDLVFWSTYRPGASHVGFYIENGKYIHAGSSKGVAINSFNPSDEDYSEELDLKYLGARRFFGGQR